MKRIKLWIFAVFAGLAVLLIPLTAYHGMFLSETSAVPAAAAQTPLRWPGHGKDNRHPSSLNSAAQYDAAAQKSAVPAASDAVVCSSPVYFLGSAARPVYLVPSLTVAQSSCSVSSIAPDSALAGEFTGVLRLPNGIQAVAAAQQHAADIVKSEHIATYQRMNIRNALMILKSAHKKDLSWANICPVAAFGADCLTDQAGVVDDVLLNPINLGNVLDYGADPSGAQMLQLQQYALGFSVGFNVVGAPEEFLAKGSSNSTAFVFGSPHHRLPFADEIFDTVLSMNILEHVQDLQLYLSEAARVLHPGGHLYISWYPSWQSGRGHHIHPDMIGSMTKKLNCSPVVYANDGSTIPDWGHLLLTKQHFIGHLHTTAFNTCSGLSEEVADYVYRNPDLNRKTYEEVTGILKSIQSLRFLRVDINPEFGLPELTAEVWRLLRIALPTSTHFRIGEARLTLQKRR